MLSSHYRNPINFSDVLMEQAKSSVERVYTCIERLEFLLKNSEERELDTDERAFKNKLDEYKVKFISAMDDDLNTADAIAAIFDIVYASNTELKDDKKNAAEAIKDALGLIRELGAILGLFNSNTEKSLDEEIGKLIEERQAARAEKDFARADAIRDKLKEMNIVLKDTPMGVQWSYIE